MSNFFEKPAHLVRSNTDNQPYRELQRVIVTDAMVERALSAYYYADSGSDWDAEEETKKPLLRSLMYCALEAALNAKEGA